MTRDRFIERLNLLLDDELSPEEADELLQAARGNPEFHRLYVQYQQIHMACAELGEAFAPAQGNRSIWRQRVYALGGMAAAVALLGLAAQNLAPMIGGEGQVTARGPGRSVVAQATATSLPHADRRTSVAMKESGQPSGERVNIRTIQVRGLDLENAFEPLDQAVLEMPRLRSQMQVASFEVAQPEANLREVFKQEFAFGQAVQASTFEHEMLSSQEAMSAALGGNSTSFSRDASLKLREAAAVRFDLSRAKMTPANASEGSVSVASPASR